ncbi:DUF6644 family protein [Methylomonas koyamae]|uniref:DUF6644 family protein n=1 Tax=Methylomonas koyamae TaxID=702114 RepID=UPI000BC325BD|nr:DUF6644 family protein [Methylomonas koyamae]ATG89814.1 hypothetical protein MKLM6_1568 [Methylomonas koyamae]
MSALETFKALQSSEFGRFIGGQNHLFCAGLELAHIVGMILLLASIALVSLRLFGIGLKQQSAAALSKATAGFVRTGLALLVGSGLLIFIPAATSYYPNDFFWYKAVLLALALATHLTAFRWVTRNETPSPLIARTTGAISLSLWLSVAFAGRFIGFF